MDNNSDVQLIREGGLKLNVSSGKSFNTGAAEGRSVWGGSQAPTRFITNVI